MLITALSIVALVVAIIAIGMGVLTRKAYAWSFSTGSVTPNKETRRTQRLAIVAIVGGIASVIYVIICLIVY